jgi:hypothetical protein
MAVNRYHFKHANNRQQIIDNYQLQCNLPTTATPAF